MSTKGNIYILDIVFSPAYNGAQVKDLQMGVVLIDVIETQDVGMVDKLHYGDLSLDLWTGEKHWLPWYHPHVGTNLNHYSCSLFRLH